MHEVSTCGDSLILNYHIDGVYDSWQVGQERQDETDPELNLQAETRPRTYEMNHADGTYSPMSGCTHE